jgi:phosphoglycolate phosphatase
MARVQTLVFDLDGTLVDSAPDLATALNALLAEQGKPSLDLKTIRGMIGDGAGVLVARGLAASGLLADGASAPKPALARFLELYRGCLTEQTRAYPGVPEILAAFKAAGHRMGICTNKPFDPTQRILKALDLDGFFGAVVGGDSLPTRKPEPEMLWATIDALSPASRAGAIMIGDSANDVLCARAAGVPAVLIPSDYGNPASEADYKLERFAELPALLERL